MLVAYLIVIPGKLAIASAIRNPEMPKTWIPAFAGMTAETADSFPGFQSSRR